MAVSLLRVWCWAALVLFCLWAGGCPVTTPGTETPGQEQAGEGLLQETNQETHPTEITKEPPFESVRERSLTEPASEKRPDAGRVDAPQEPPTKPDQQTKEPSPEPTIDTTTENIPEKKPDSVSPMIGDPCKKDNDCGIGRICVPEGANPPFPFPNQNGQGPPGGYCSVACMIGGTACPAGAVCYVPGAAAGMCLKSCTQASDCRANEGYTCNQADGQNKGCFPPACSIKQAGGPYWATVSSSRTQGTCSGKPSASGTRFPVSVKIQNGDVSFTFGSKPMSPLPVTWSLVGAYQAGTKIRATNPKGCQQSCDGVLTTQINNPCQFYGTLEIQVTASCVHSYELAFSKR